MTILLFVMLGVFVFMMFRRNKKTQQQQAQLQSKFAPGVEVMTSFGLFGRIVDIETELAGPDGAHIATGPTAHDQHLGSYLRHLMPQ